MAALHPSNLTPQTFPMEIRAEFNPNVGHLNVQNPPAKKLGRGRGSRLGAAGQLPPPLPRLLRGAVGEKRRAFQEEWRNLPHLPREAAGEAGPNTTKLTTDP